MADLRTFLAMTLLLATAIPCRAQTPARVDALLAADSVSEAAAAADAVVRDASVPAAQRAAVAALFGRFTAADNADAGRDLGPGTSSALARLAAGAVPASLETIEQGLARRPGRASALRAITELGFGARGTGPALRATTDDPGMLLLVYMAARDTAGVRETVAAIDSARARLTFRNLPPPVQLAEAELLLGDSAAALARLAAFDASWTRMERTVSWGATQNGWTLGRTWLLLGDLARALEHRDDAARAYRRVIALWDNGDADVQPAVAHARAALAELEGAHASPASAPRETVAFARPDGSATRVRYDAVLWMQPRVGGGEMGVRPLARLGFVTTEQTSRSGAAWLAAQSYDSVTVDMPLLDALGSDGLAIRRQIQAAAGAMTATTRSDAGGRITTRSLETGAMLPDELRALLERGAGFGPLSMAMPLPGRSITIGAAWSDSIALGIPGLPDARGIPLRATYRLTRLTSAGGRRLAFISVDARTTGAVRSGTDAVEATLTGELVRDLESNETIRLAASLRATITTATGTTTPVRVLLTALREGATPAPALAMR